MYLYKKSQNFLFFSGTNNKIRRIDFFYIFNNVKLEIYNKYSQYKEDLFYSKINNLELKFFFFKIKFFEKKKFLVEKFFFSSLREFYIWYFSIKKKLINFLRGYCLIFNLIGLGFTMTIWKKRNLRFNIGYNHLIYYYIPKNILIRSRSRRNLFLFSNSYFFLKKISVEIKNFRRLSVYKLKGIKEKNELYIKKNWKKGIY